MKINKYFAFMGLTLLLLVGCNGRRTPTVSLDEAPLIFPDYKGVTIPKNIASLNFSIDGATHVQATLSVGGECV